MRAKQKSSNDARKIQLSLDAYFKTGQNADDYTV
jgi:hypothetical protein